MKILSPWAGSVLRVEPQSGLGMIICGTSAASRIEMLCSCVEMTLTLLCAAGCVCAELRRSPSLAPSLSRLKTRPEAWRFDFESDFARAANTPISLRGCN